MTQDLKPIDNKRIKPTVDKEDIQKIYDTEKYDNVNQLYTDIVKLKKYIIQLDFALGDAEYKFATLECDFREQSGKPLKEVEAYGYQEKISVVFSENEDLVLLYKKVCAAKQQYTIVKNLIDDVRAFVVTLERMMNHLYFSRGEK